MAELTPDHREFLAAQAVNPDLAEKLGVRSLLGREDTADLGGVWENWANFPAILFPWTRPDGRVEYQVRPDNPTEDGRGRPRKYVFRRGMEPVLWALRPITGTTERVLIVEGTKQALAAATYAPETVAVYGIAGCRMWQKEGRPIPDLGVVDGYRVVVCLDSDSATNLDVYRAGAELAEALEQEGATSVLFTRIKGGEKDGLDDVLAAREEHRRAAWLARAIDSAKVNPADRCPKAKAKATPNGAGDARGEMLPSPAEPLAVARVIEPELMVGSTLTVRNWRGGWWEWRTAHWSEIEELAFSKRLYERTEHARYEHVTDKGVQVKPWAPTRTKVAFLADALAAITHLDQATHVPAWLSGDRPEGTIVACQNGLLRLEGRELMAHDPGYFNLVSVPFDYDSAAPEPIEWLRFLEVLWPDGGEGQVDALQEWFGYVISGRTDFQKMFAIIGPPRSGKGTIATVLTSLIGAMNTAGPTLAGLATNFGLQPVLGKSLALISDARIGRQTDVSVVVERLLTISGEDIIQVDRKNRDAWVGRIPARVMLMSNELPRFSDDSGTIATRWVVVETVQSFLGREDRTLKPRLLRELPGILNWALTGLDRLLSRGYFQDTAVGNEAVDIMREGASPYAAFKAEALEEGQGYEVALDDLWSAWGFWCKENGRDHPGTKPRLARDIKTVAPGVRTVQPRRPDGSRYRALQGIRLRDGYAGLGLDCGTGSRAAGTGRGGPGTGRGTGSQGTKAQVSGFGTGRHGQNHNSRVSESTGSDTAVPPRTAHVLSTDRNAVLPVPARAKAPETASDLGKRSGTGNGPARATTRATPLRSAGCSDSICGCGSCRWDSASGRYLPAA
ncbi:phage/plasmid primase, P4 family [Micromonospora aurantiaca]|uniref:DNA primase family protein n=1 Tax=Micromonospora aurantiaca (nom. illeg.) TaxID=47850 RepID=UPI0034146965